VLLPTLPNIILYPKNDIINFNNFSPVSVVGIIKVNLLWLIFIVVLHPQLFTSIFFLLLPPFSLFCVVWSGKLEITLSNERDGKLGPLQTTQNNENGGRRRKETDVRN